jgi:hypothetical protein
VSRNMAICVKPRVNLETPDQIPGLSVKGHKTSPIGMPKVTPPVSAPTNNLPSNTAGEGRTCVGSLALDAQSISSGRPQMTLFHRSIPSEVLTAYTVLPPAK